MNISFVCNNHNSLALADLATKIAAASGGGTVTAICSPLSRDRFADKLLAKYCAIEVLDFAPVEASGSAVPNVPPETRADTIRKAGKRLPHWMINASVSQWLQQKLFERRIAATKVHAQALLARLSPSVLLSISDRSHDYVECAALWAARQAGIPVLLPYVTQFDIDAALLSRIDARGKLQPDFHPFKPFSFYKLLSYIRLRHQMYRGAFFQAPAVLNAHRRAGTLSQYPWQIGHGASDVVCVNSQASAEIYSARGVPAEKISIAGDVYYDDIVRAARDRAGILERFAAKYGLDPERKILVIALPQLMEQGVIDAETHWREIRYILETSASLGVNVMVSLHPRMNRPDYAFIEAEYGCHIADERLAEFLPIGDVFLATNSNTLVWSVLMGINTVIMNFRHLADPLGFPLSSPNVIAELDQLRPALLRAVEERTDFSHDWALLSKSMVFDGHTTDRYLSLIEQAAREKRR